MDPAKAVLMNPAVTLIGFLAVIVILLLLIAKWKWHVFSALLLPILLFGIIPGVQTNNFIKAFQNGFGKTLGKIGVIIVLGSIIAEYLKHTGAIETITKSMIKMVGKKRMPLALTLAGFVLGVAIFSDVAYVILNPLVHSAAAAMGVGMSTMATGLVGALQLTHAIVPPTPGPLAAAALVGADIGKCMIFGSLACLFGALASWAWGQFVVGPRLDKNCPPDSQFVGNTFLDRTDAENKATPLPSTWGSYAPIAVPILLIAAQSVAKLTLPAGHPALAVLSLIGWPVIALTIGCFLGYLLIKKPEDKALATNKWIEDALRVSAMMLVVTGLGGSLSAILKGTPAVKSVADFFATTGVPAIFLPFVMGVIGNMITGSTTVGVITAGSLVAPMLGDLGLSPEAAMLSGASGSVIIKYVNSSYFWICTSLSGMKVKDAILSYGGATLVGGISSFIAVYVMWTVGMI